MRVLYLTNNAGRASTTVATRGWFRHLAPRGLRPVLASPVLGEFSDWARGLGVASYRVPMPPPQKSWPFPFLWSLWRLRRIVKEHQVELIHCNEQDVYPIGNYLARLCGLPVVVGVHCAMERGYCEWAFRKRRCPDRIFFISRGNLETCRGAVGGVVPVERWRLLYNGLDLDHYRPDPVLREKFRQAHGMDGAVAVGVACAFRPGKQLEHLFEAFARLGRPDARLFVAGFAVPGDEAYAERLLEGARARLGPRFNHLGCFDDVRPFFNGLDVFVNTSQGEACSISVLESLACGCPVLGYPSKSVDDQILPDGGEITPQDDVPALAAALGRWLDDPDGLARRRALARRQAEERFDIRKLADELWSEYRALLGRPVVPAEPRPQPAPQPLP